MARQTKRRPTGNYSAAWRSLAAVREDPGEEEPTSPVEVKKMTPEEMATDVCNQIDRCLMELWDGWKAMGIEVGEPLDVYTMLESGKVMRVTVQWIGEGVKIVDIRDVEEDERI